MHSWRVLLLPFMERRDLYDKYDFSEPWDGRNNRQLHGEIVRWLCCPSFADKQPRTQTCYVAVVGRQTAWPGATTTKYADYADGTSNTLLVVEVLSSGIHWMEPRDLHMRQMPLQINPAQGQGISSAHPNAAMAVVVDGHTQALSQDTPPETLRALLTIAGGEKVGDY